jgi:arylsulfatase A-like enzyme
MSNGLNVIVICCDTLRADIVDQTHEDRVHMPNVQRLRKEGTTFTQAYAEALPTVPMRRGFYTGRRAFPWKHNIDDRGSEPNLVGWHAIPSEYTTLAETLCQNGVLTGLVADLYHLFKPTMNFTRGFASYDYIRGQETDRVRCGPLSKIDLKPHTHPDEKDPSRLSGFVQYLLNTMDRKTEEDYFAPRVFRSAAQWLDDNAGQKPFYLQIESFTPHEFWDPPKHFADAYFTNPGGVDFIYPQYFAKHKFSPADIKRTKALYYGYCTFVDKWIGDFLEKLDDHKLWDNTVVVFTSDHGTELMDRDMFGKSAQHLNPFNTRLNMIVRHPEKSTHGKTVDAFVQNIDLAPTICNWMNVNSAEPYEGLDMMPLIEGKKGARDHVIGSFAHCAFVRDNQHNYIVNTLDPNQQTELYDIKADKLERENIAAAKPEIVKAMRAKLENLLGAPLPAKYAHQVNQNQKGGPPGLRSLLPIWKLSNLG